MDLEGGRVGSEESFALGDEFVEGVAGLHESPLALKSQIINVLDQQNLSETASERHRLHLIETSGGSKEQVTASLLSHEELGSGVCQHFSIKYNNNQWLVI